MNPQQGAVANESSTRAGRAPKKKNYKLFLLAWLLLISSGIMGAYLYTERMQQQITDDVNAKTEAKLAMVQKDYQKQLDQLKTDVTENMTVLRKKVDSFNQLLKFTKDTTSSKTDNSNQLYTQLQEVRKKLDELQKNLEVLK